MASGAHNTTSKVPSTAVHHHDFHSLELCIQHLDFSGGRPAAENADFVQGNAMKQGLEIQNITNIQPRMDARFWFYATRQLEIKQHQSSLC